MKANEHPDWETYKKITTPHDGDWSYEAFVKNYVNKMTYFKRRKEVIDNFPWETAELKFISVTFNNRDIQNRNGAIEHYKIEFNEFKPRYDKELRRLKNPYWGIFQPIYEYRINRWDKLHYSGVNDFTIEMAGDYAKGKIQEIINKL